MGKLIGIVVLVIAIVALIGVTQSLYTVDEVNYAVVQQFGDIRRVSTTPGLHVKVPIIQQVTYLDRRVLTSDTSAEEYLTSDQKRIVVDQVTRWRITDPRNFFIRLTTESGGRARLERLVLGGLREQIARKPYDVMISAERDDIMDLVKLAVQAQVKESQWGIEIVDVRTKRADLPTAVEQSVYDRMEAERQVEAERHRATGQREAARITSETDRLVINMLACADRVSKETRGAGEAFAIAIFAEALQQDPDFFSFIRRLEAYETSFGTQDRLVMSTDSNFFQLLSGQAIPIPDVEATEGPVTPLSEEVIATLTPEELETLIQSCIPATVEELTSSS